MRKTNNQLIDVLENLPSDDGNYVFLNENERRILIDDRIYDMILKGTKKNKIKKYIKEQGERFGFNYTENHLNNIYFQVKGRIKREFEEDREFFLSDINDKLLYLYKTNIAKEDYKEARECLKDIAKLVGLTNGNSVEIKNDEQDIKISFG